MTPTALAEHLERSLAGPMWHGSALLPLLREIAPAQAAARPVAEAHTIWELVLHVAAWAEIGRARLHSPGLVEATPEEDWPPVPATPDAAAWREAVARLERAHRALADAVRALPAERLEEVVPGRDHTVRVMLHGIVEHGVYHLGQVALLRRALQA